MLTPIFHNNSSEPYWNINQILNRDIDTDEEDDDDNAEPAEKPASDDEDIFDDDEEILSISECF